MDNKGFLVQRGLDEEKYPNSYERQFDTLAEARAFFNEAILKQSDAEWRIAEWIETEKKFKVHDTYPSEKQ